jgi:uncharacterized protein (TIGR00369 family)
MKHAPPLPRRSDSEQARLETALQVYVRSVAFNQMLGLEAESVRPAQVRIRLDMRPNLIGTAEHRRLHGGAIATALDVAGGMALMVAMADKHGDETIEQLRHRFARMGTIDLRIDYLRPGLGEYFVAAADVIRLGGRIGSTQMRLVNDHGTLIATGVANYIVS